VILFHGLMPIPTKKYLKFIKTPTSITPAILPTKDKISEFIENGGHVGFIDGSIFKPKYYLEYKIPNFLKKYEST